MIPKSKSSNLQICPGCVWSSLTKLKSQIIKVKLSCLQDIWSLKNLFSVLLCLHVFVPQFNN